jgi:hypothetical protein
MSLESAVIVAAICLAFGIFAGVLGWVDRYTNGRPQHLQPGE